MAIDRNNTQQPALGHLSNPSDRSDEGNQRPATPGETEFYGLVSSSTARPGRGPMAGLDLVTYMRTGKVQRHPRTGIAVRDPAPIPTALCYRAICIPDVDHRGEPSFRVIAVPETDPRFPNN